MGEIYFTTYTGASRVLELGTFTGYSAICLASGLPHNGHLDTLELNDELEDLILEGFERAGLSEVIDLHIGDCKQTLKQFRHQMGLVPWQISAAMLLTALLQRSTLYALGAVVFVFSDFILAWNKFVEPVPYRDYLVLGTYFLAQWLLFVRSTPYRIASL